MTSHHEELLQTAIAAVSKQKPRNIYFVACGGSLAFMHNQQYIIDRETDIPSFILSSNEFVHRSPRHWGQVLSSLPVVIRVTRQKPSKRPSLHGKKVH